MAYKSKIFVAVNLTLHGHIHIYTHICVQFKKNGINEEKEICLPNRE